MASASWTIDNQNSEVSLTVKKLGLFTIKGTLSDFSGEISFSKEAPGDANFAVCVSPSTIDTDNVKRDEHLKSKDFFHVHAHPKICFASTALQVGADGYQAIGNLTMLGVTKEVIVPFTFSDGSFVGQFTISRLDFKLGEKFPAFIVGKNIHITISCKTK